MKRGTPDHPKTHDLATALSIDRWGAVGILECLWHFTSQFAKRGDIGRRSNAAIARGIGWTGDADQLVDALVSTGWVDRCRCHRLRIHDWPEHCDQTLKRAVEVKNQGFIDCYEDASALLADDEQSTGQPLPLPLPTPEPEPEPTPDGVDDVVRLRREVSALLARLTEQGRDGQRELVHASRTRDGRTVTNPAAIPTAAWARVIHDRLTARLLELSEPAEEADPSPLEPAVAWIGDRGGAAACVQSALAMTGGDPTPAKVRTALRKAGAPPGVFGLLGPSLHSAQARAT